MVVRAKELAHLLQGTVEGNPEEQVSQFAKIEEAQKGSLSFFANPKYESFVYSTKASILLVANDFKLAQPIEATLIRVADPYSALAMLLDEFGKAQMTKKSGVSKWAAVQEDTVVGANAYIGDFVSIGKGVKIGEDVCIEANVSIGDHVQIGDGTILMAGVKIGHSCVVGQHCLLHAGVVIGSDGFGFAPQADGSYKKVSQVGKVLIEDDVEIGANATIDRGSIGDTVIRKGVKLDNLVHLAHNVEVGENTVIASQTGVAGSTKIGKNCMIGGQVGIVGHIRIADGTKINAQSGVSKSIEEPNMVVTGSPAFAYASALRAQAVFRRLPDIEKQIAELSSILKK
ncbi:MAG: UDP-3-O-(3-hydroxymyristoyl)glucosamine N-acyltransferase [Bacteroidota bacterium]